MTDEIIMKAFSHNKKRLLIAILLAVGFLFTSSTSMAMPLYMYSNECVGKTVCEKCCLISVPELSGLQYEYSFSACPDFSSADRADPDPLPFDHPPQ